MSWFTRCVCETQMPLQHMHSQNSNIGSFYSKVGQGQVYILKVFPKGIQMRNINALRQVNQKLRPAIKLITIIRLFSKICQGSRSLSYKLVCMIYLVPNSRLLGIRVTSVHPYNVLF